jgi:hypothetical protein
MTTRQWLDEKADPHDNMRRALSWLDKVTKPKHVALLAIPTKGNLDGVISDVISEKLAKALAEGKAIELPSGGKVLLATERVPSPPGWNGGPVLVVHGDKNLLGKVDSLRSLTDVLAVAWSDKDVAEWVKTWSAPRLGAQPSPTTESISNPVVARAMGELCRAINLKDGGVHPSDHARIVETFKILCDEGEDFDPAEIRTFLIKDKGMASGRADRISDIAVKIKSGKRVVTRDKARKWENNIIDRWRE